MITVDDIDVDDFKTWFFRDFHYAIPAGKTESILDCPKSAVMDLDIEKAFTEAKMNFNQGLFGTDDALKTTFLYLTAFYLVNDLQTAEAGTGSAGFFPVNSRAIGSVSESYSIPEWMSKDPILGNYMTNRYGQKYLSLIKPLLIGNVQVFQGATTYW